MTFREKLERRIDAALGRIPCDLIFQDITYLDVFSLEWRKGDVSLIDGCIVGLESGLKAKQTVSGKERFLVPGFIDAHVHIESSLMVPDTFSGLVLQKGTTTVVADPHELANVMGVKGLEYFLDAAIRSPLNLRVMLSSCVPATDMETNGAGHLVVEDLLPYQSHSHALGLAEVMNMPGVLFKNKEVLDKVERFSHGNMDGHAPLLRGRELSAYASTGISSCHESSQLEEAQEKLMKGVHVWIREGSVAKDLDALLPMLNLATSSQVGFCTDDRNPLDIIEEGHVDFLVRKAIQKGVDPKVALRAGSYSVARHYGLDRGRERLGAIAPGYTGNFVLLNDLNSLSIADVFSQGISVKQLDFANGKSKSFENTIRADAPSEESLKGPEGQVHTIVVHPGKILTDRSVENQSAKGVAKLTVLERYGKKSKPSNGYVRGFGENFSGAIASSVGHDSHNLIVTGSGTKDMQVALKALIESGGGFCVAQGGKVLSHLALPFGGLMTGEGPEEIHKKLKDLKKASQAIGCALFEPFLQLAFLSLPVIPSLKLTDKGLVDVDKFQIIDVRAS